MNFRDILSAYYGTVTDSNAEMVKVEIMHAVDTFTGHGISKQKADSIRSFLPDVSANRLRTLCTSARFRRGSWDMANWRHSKKES